MKLLEKLKNTFFEEEYIEVDEPERKEVVARKIEPKESKLKEIKPKEVKKEEKISFKSDDLDIPVVHQDPKIENYSDGEIVRSESKVPYFEDEDFLNVDLEVQKKEEPKKIYGGSSADLYSSLDFSNNSNKPYSAPAKEAFKPTPIISPIYGVLDKNYKKEEVIDKKDKPSSYVSRKNADLDSVRKKAYGGLDPLEEMNNISSKEEIEEDNFVYDITGDDSKPVVDQVTIADAEEYFQDLGLEYNIDYKDSRYEKATGRRTSINRQKLEKKVEDDTSDDANLEDNLFDLIDSMCEDGEE